MAEARLKPLDSEHFYVDDVLVDMNQLYYDVGRRSKESRGTGLNTHQCGVTLSTLHNYARLLHKGKAAEELYPKVKRALEFLNTQGIHTGLIG